MAGVVVVIEGVPGSVSERDIRENAEALARRSSTYANDNARTWQLRFDRGQEPPNERSLVIDLRRAYGAEVPTKMHEGPDHVDAGGTPAYSAAFAAYLYGSPMATDRKDAGGTVEIRLTPVRAALRGMALANEEATRQKGAIVYGVVVGGMTPDAAARAVLGDIPKWALEACAEQALRMFWRRCSDVRLDLARTETAA